MAKKDFRSSRAACNSPLKLKYQNSKNPKDSIGIALGATYGNGKTTIIRTR
ncbi:hypothetical protein [Chryseobacterium salviniae]|uniref:Uncharacterized protein n=1 Tax=Chryseobacterium salviniae TaxID=3101750 RepID=A0ABU6HUZ6_9FLAO|nr:hypothetical protein [Chryseobacterium sp. T9W2-O]MEC3876901.1 hypothetical protein [Chryseobacterium sp. T9W2-O]